MARQASIAEQAASAAATARWGAEEARSAAAAAQQSSDEKRGAGIGRRVSNWEWVEYAEQSARRAQEYARAATAAAQDHNIPEAHRRLRNAQSEADGAWSNAERAGAIPRYLRTMSPEK